MAEMETKTEPVSYRSKPVGNEPRKHHSGLVWIGVFKLVKVVLLVISGLVVMNLLHRDLTEVAKQVLQGQFHMDPDGRLVHWVLDRTPGIQEKSLRRLMIGLFLYAVLYTAEGIGLVLEKAWGEVLTIVTTSLLIPVEIYEIIHKPNAIKVAFFVLNVLILVYVVIMVRQKWKNAHGREKTAGAGVG